MLYLLRKDNIKALLMRSNHPVLQLPGSGGAKKHEGAHSVLVSPGGPDGEGEQRQGVLHGFQKHRGQGGF